MAWNHPYPPLCSTSAFSSTRSASHCFALLNTSVRKPSSLQHISLLRSRDRMATGYLHSSTSNGQYNAKIDIIHSYVLGARQMLPSWWNVFHVFPSNWRAIASIKVARLPPRPFNSGRKPMTPVEKSITLIDIAHPMETFHMLLWGPSDACKTSSESERSLRGVSVMFSGSEPALHVGETTCEYSFPFHELRVTFCESRRPPQAHVISIVSSLTTRAPLPLLSPAFQVERITLPVWDTLKLMALPKRHQRTNFFLWFSFFHTVFQLFHFYAFMAEIFIKRAIAVTVTDPPSMRRSHLEWIRFQERNCEHKRAHLKGKRVHKAGQE